jgi:hypothetical protein
MVSSLRRWLRRSPQPHKLRVDGRDLAVATGANQWAVTEESVVAMAPSKIEALDASGLVLRALALDKGEDEDASTPVDKPRGAESDLVTLGRLLNEAADNAAKRHENAYRLAFEENTKLVGTLVDRLGGLETAWQKAMGIAARAQADAMAAQAMSGEGGDPAGAAIANMLGAAAAHHLSAAPNGVAKNGNGAPAKKGA